MPFNRHGGGSGYNKGGNSFGAKRPWDRGTRSSNGFDDRPKFKATCASCGDACEVPFKPNGRKPIYCRACFGKTEAPERSDRFERKGASEYRPAVNDGTADQLRAISAKLDAILKALDPRMSMTAPVAKKTEAPSTKLPEAKVEAKKAEIKKMEAPKAPTKKKAVAKKKK